MPVNIEITDDEILVTAENGTRVRLSRQDGVMIPPLKASDLPRARARRVAQSLPDQVKVSPRWILHVGDFVLGQHKPGGRKFRAKVRAIKVENGTTYVQVADPRNGGTYLLPLDRLTRLSRKALAS